MAPFLQPDPGSANAQITKPIIQNQQHTSCILLCFCFSCQAWVVPIYTLRYIFKQIDYSLNSQIVMFLAMFWNNIGCCIWPTNRTALNFFKLNLLNTKHSRVNNGSGRAQRRPVSAIQNIAFVQICKIKKWYCHINKKWPISFLDIYSAV